MSIDDRYSMLKEVYLLKSTIRGTSSCIVLTMDIDRHSEIDVLRLKHLCDVVLQINPVVDTSDLAKMAADSRSLSSLLTIEKLTMTGTWMSDKETTEIYGIRHQKRRLSIKPIEMDPEGALSSSGTFVSQESSVGGF